MLQKGAVEFVMRSFTGLCNPAWRTCHCVEVTTALRGRYATDIVAVIGRKNAYLRTHLVDNI
jgi:hypothetical protein